MRIALVALISPVRSAEPWVMNVVYILADDHRYDFMGFHPNAPKWLETPTRTAPAAALMTTATALVVGNMIGSGIFLLPTSLAAFGGVSAGTEWAVLGALIGGGIALGELTRMVLLARPQASMAQSPVTTCTLTTAHIRLLSQ